MDYYLMASRAYIIQNIKINYPSDGLLPSYTQQLKGIPHGNVYRVDFANHLEVRNMSKCPQGDGTYNTFTLILNRNDIFGTPKRLP